MNTHIIQLIEDALTHMGCPLSVMSHINPDSPIVFNFNNGVQMHLMMVEDDLWLYSSISPYSDHLIAQHGAAFLELIMTPLPFFVTGKLHLSNQNGELILQGLVNKQSTEKAPHFAAALQVFFDTAVKLQQVVGQ